MPLKCAQFLLVACCLLSLDQVVILKCDAIAVSPRVVQYIKYVLAEYEKKQGNVNRSWQTLAHY